MGSVSTTGRDVPAKQLPQKGLFSNRNVHRVGGLFASLLFLWIAGTGSLVQLLDFKSTFTHEAPTTPTQLSMAEGMWGPGGYAVIQERDFGAAALPGSFDIRQGVATVLQAVHTQQAQQAPVAPSLAQGGGPGAAAGADPGVRTDATRGEVRGGGGAARPGDARQGNGPDGRRGPGGDATGEQAAHPDARHAPGQTIATLHKPRSAADAALNAGSADGQTAQGGDRPVVHTGARPGDDPVTRVHDAQGAHRSGPDSGRAGRGEGVQGRDPQAGPAGGRRAPAGESAPRAESISTNTSPSTGTSRSETPRAGGPRGSAYNPMAWVELRVADGVPIGQVMLGTKLEAFNAQTGQPVTAVPPIPMPQGRGLPFSYRQKLKTLHRFWNRGDTPGVYFEFLSGLILLLLIITGLVMYFQLLSARRRQGRSQIFWLTGGGLWRGLHRVISVASAAFILCMAFTGTWIGFESSASALRRSGGGPPPAAAGQPGAQGQPGTQGQQSAQEQTARANAPNNAPGAAPQGQPGAGGGRRRNPVDFIIPLRDAEVQEMTATTMASMQKLHPDTPIKAVRLRIYGQMKQGVVITGGDHTDQFVFNADTGQPASLSEQGYPESGFPFGVQVHENIKHFHSGAMFGIPGRLMNLFGGFSLLFLSVSGIVMYLDMWSKRRRGGRNNLVWR